jgi:hypothetical protein
VVLLEQDHRREVEPVVAHSAGGDRGLVERSKPGRCLAGVQDPYRKPGHRLREGGGGGGDAGHPLQEVQGCPLARDDPSCGPCQREQVLPGVHAVAVVDVLGDDDVAAELPVHLGWDRGAGDHAVLAGDDPRMGAGAVRHGPAGGDVVLGAVLGQRAAHGVRHGVDGDRHDLVRGGRRRGVVRGSGGACRLQDI